MTQNFTAKNGIQVEVQMWDGGQWWTPMMGILHQNVCTRVRGTRNGEVQFEHEWTHADRRNFLTINSFLVEHGCPDIVLG